MLERITFFDVETPNRHNDKICSIGIVHMDQGVIKYDQELMIDPECPFDSFNIKLHGVSPQSVKGAPTFKEAWAQLAPLFQNSLIVAHNASFDMGVLAKVLAFYHIPAPTFLYACTVQMARKRLPKQPFNLAALANSLDVGLARHHNAHADTRACYGIYMKLVALMPIKQSEIKTKAGTLPIEDKVLPPAQVLDPTPVGSRGLLFSFDHIGMTTNVYAINGRGHIYIIDTYLGPDIMYAIDQHLNMAFGPKPRIIINTHSHWDHIWGNCHFPQAMIISHTKCRARMAERGQGDLTKPDLRQYHMGMIQLTLPNTTFTNTLAFEDDSILIWHTPGHTDDSISVFDAQDSILYASDNLERPLPFIEWGDLDQYQDTLTSYLTMQPKIVIGGHTAIEDVALICDNLDYILALRGAQKTGATTSPALAPYERAPYLDSHRANLKFLKEN